MQMIASNASRDDWHLSFDEEDWRMMPAPENDQKLVDELGETSEGLSWRLSPRMIAALGASGGTAQSTSGASGAQSAPAAPPAKMDARPPTHSRARTRAGRNVGPIGGGALASSTTFGDDVSGADAPMWSMSPSVIKAAVPASTSSNSDLRALAGISFDNDDWDLLANLGDTPRNAPGAGEATPRTRAAATACRARRMNAPSARAS